MARRAREFLSDESKLSGQCGGGPFEWHLRNTKSSRGKIIAVLIAVGVLAAIFVRFGGREGDSDRAGLQVRQVSVAIERYLRSHGQQLPAMEDRVRLETTLLPYLDRDKKLTTPLLARPETREPYTFNLALSGKKRNEFPRPENTIVFYESHENYGGRLVAFLDGHHIWATSKQWTQITQQKIFGLH